MATSFKGETEDDLREVNNVVEDAEEIREILSVVSTEIPKLLNAISESIFNPEQTEQYAVAVADFYSRLKQAGMEDDMAVRLTEQFMDRTNFAAMIQELIGGRGIHIGGRGDRSSGEVKRAVEKAVREKVKEELGDVEDEGE